MSASTLWAPLELGQQRGELLNAAIRFPQIHERDAPLETDRAPLLVGAHELERARVEVPRLVGRHRIAGPLGSRQVVPHRSLGLTRLTAVVRQDPRDLVRIVHAAFDLGGHGGVQRAPGGPGEHLVRGVAHEHVLEGVLDVSAHPAPGLSSHEPGRPQGVERDVDVLDAVQGGHDPAPERLAHDGGMQQGGTRLGRQRIDPGDGRRADRRWKHLGVGIDRRDELLEEQRVALGGLYHPVDRRPAIGRDHPGDHLGGLVDGERIERQGRLRRHVGPPGTPPLEELGACEPDEHRRSRLHMGHQVLDQVEQRVVGPVDILEHEHQRVAGGKLLDESARRVLQVDRIVGRLVDAETHQQGEVPRPFGRLLSGQEAGDQILELAPGVGGRVVLEDAGRPSHDLGDGTVRRLLCVREAAAPQDPRPATLELVGRLAGEARLPDARWTEHRDQVWLIRGHDPLPRFADRLQLTSPADQRRR